MKWRNLTAKELRNIPDKLNLQDERETTHYYGWYILDGEKALRICLPNIHGGKKSVSSDFLQQVRRSLKLTSEQMVDLAVCPITGEDYDNLMRAKRDAGKL
jgi:hypothetical protein